MKKNNNWNSNSPMNLGNNTFWNGNSYDNSFWNYGYNQAILVTAKTENDKSLVSIEDTQ